MKNPQMHTHKTHINKHMGLCAHSGEYCFTKDVIME